MYIYILCSELHNKFVIVCHKMTTFIKVVRAIASSNRSLWLVVAVATSIDALLAYYHDGV